MKRSSEAQTSVQKVNFFSTGDQLYEKKSISFRFLADIGVSVDILILEPYEIAELQMFGNSRSNFI